MSRNNEKPCMMVTGAGGALAQIAIRRLKPFYKIIAVDFRKAVDLGEDVESFKMDFNKRVFEDLFKDFNFSAVMHLGRIETSESTNLNRFNANVVGTQKLLDFCVKYKATNVLVLSSFHVYGAHLYNPAPIDEHTPLKASELTLKLVDTVELDNLARIYLWKYPELNIKLLRPCSIVGPGMRNSMSRLLSSGVAPVLMGFSPLHQFIHCDDMARALETAMRKNKRGVYNVAPDDWIGLQEAVVNCGCRRMFLPGIPAALSIAISKVLSMDSFPSYLVNFFRYPVIIDPKLFNETHNFKVEKSLEDIFAYYKKISL